MLESGGGYPMNASARQNVHIAQAQRERERERERKRERKRESQRERERKREVAMGGEEVKKAMELEAAGAEGGEEVTWEKFLHRAPVRVLLVEGDDSTRQIITALLRKCGYRVSVASDGFKAWEMLREKDHNIDLVLTEVELPQISGLVLLTMMMDQDSCCNHLPVIMMSSNDSVNIAFKCLMKGAADFLVKPIRKNELKNLWQHVWRKQKGENGAAQSKTVDLCLDHRSIKNATDKQDDKDFCEKESDAQSSCTRSDMEVESACKLQNNMELNRARHEKLALFYETTSPDNHFEKQLDGLSLFRNDEANGVISLDSHIQPEGNSDCQQLDRDESSTELFDLIEVINNQPWHISTSEKSRDKFAENLADTELEKKPKSLPSLELSLDGFPHNREENDLSVALHHSNSSAFSLYNNNNTAVPKLSKITSSQAQNHASSNSSTEPGGTKFMDAAPSYHEGTTFRCTPIRIIPFPVPVPDAGFDHTGPNPFLQPIFYPQSAPFWSPLPSIFPQAFTENQQRQDDEEEEEEAELLEEQRHVSTVTGDSASVCNDIRYNLNENVSTSVSNGSSFNICEASGRSGDDDGLHTCGDAKRADNCRLSQREAALTKFRLKRKERCFEKKVRYLSRQKLAEQRPRVKGQFVRQG